MHTPHRGQASHSSSCERGTSLLEALLAALLLSTVLAAIAQLIAVAGSTNLAARAQTVATIVAAQKLEQLRSLAADSGPASGGSLTANVAGFVDHLDATGAVVGTGEARSAGAVYTRRWSIVAQSWSPGAWLIQVRVVQRRTLAELSTVVGSYAR